MRGAPCARTTARTETAWDYLPHDHARSRAYRWNEDGLAGICDRQQRVCFALALWNGRDPILKERLFGLTGSEGNHGEDVKEYYFYLDSTPTHSYMRYLYKYPQARVPVRAAGRREQAPEQARTRVRAGRHRRVRRRPLLRRVRRVREGGQRRPVRADHGREPRTRCGAAASAADDLVPQHVVVERRCHGVRRMRAGCRRARRHLCDRAGARGARRPVAVLRRTRRSCSSPRTTRTPSGCSGTRTAHATSRTASTKRS